MKGRESAIANWPECRWVSGDREEEEQCETERKRVIWEAFSSILNFSILLSYLTTSMYSFEKELKLKLIFSKNLKFVLK